MNTIFYFIRHGKVNNPEKIVYGRLPIHLSNEGKFQIKNLAKKFKKENIVPSVIFSSDMVRTKESTAEILKVFPKTKVVYSKGLEETNLGDLTGKKLEIQYSIGDIYNPKKRKEMKIEDPKSIIDRQMKVISKAVKSYEGKNIFVLGHKDPLEFLMWKLANPQIKKIPSLVETEKEFLIGKGETWKFILKENLEVESCKKVK